MYADVVDIWTNVYLNDSLVQRDSTRVFSIVSMKKKIKKKKSCKRGYNQTKQTLEIWNRTKNNALRLLSPFILSRLHTRRRYIQFTFSISFLSVPSYSCQFLAIILYSFDDFQQINILSSIDSELRIAIRCCKFIIYKTWLKTES